MVENISYWQELIGPKHFEEIIVMSLLETRLHKHQASEDLSCLALVTEAFGGKGGIAQFNRDFLCALDRTKRMRRICIIPRLGDAEPPREYSALLQLKSRFNKIRYAGSAAFAALSQKPNIVLCGHLYHGPLAEKIARVTGARLLSVLHGTEVWDSLSPQHLEPLMKSDRVICVSEDTRQRLLRQVPGLCKTRVVVLHNTVDDRFQPGNREAARAIFSLDNLPTILTVGRLDDRGGYKGHDKIIPIIRRLKTNGRPTRYIIAGEGPDQPRLQSLVDELDIADLVTFLGYVADDALPDLYRAADVFALPSTGEGFGIVYLEAMACGTPALGLDIGGASEALGLFGKAVRESQLEEVLIAMTDRVYTEHEELSAKVRAQFGRRVFEERVALQLNEVI